MSQPEATPTPLWSDTPSERDLFGFSDIAAPALEALDREKLDPVTVGVVGWWGSGKSTILKLMALRVLPGIGGASDSLLRDQCGMCVASVANRRNERGSGLQRRG